MKHFFLLIKTPKFDVLNQLVRFNLYLEGYLIKSLGHGLGMICTPMIFLL